MCVLLLLAAALVAAIVALILFVKTASLLLPWSLGAAALAALLSVALGKLLLSSPLRGYAMPASIVTAMVLTLGLGHLGCKLIPPKVPPPPPRQYDLRDAMEMPRPTQQKLEQHLPIHLAIAALMNAAAVAILWPVVTNQEKDQLTEPPSVA